MSIAILGHCCVQRIDRSRAVWRVYSSLRNLLFVKKITQGREAGDLSERVALMKTGLTLYDLVNES